MDVAQRGARLARRHRLVERATTVEEAAGSVVALHATDPATIAMSAWARMNHFAVAELERALYAERTLVKHMAMRRTLWVFPRATVPAAQAAASDRVAGAERRRLVKQVEEGGLHVDGARWLDAACAAVLAALADGREVSMKQLRSEIPLLEGALTYGEGKSWGGQVPVGPRVLTVLSAEGRIVRSGNDGAWTTSRPLWSMLEPFERLDARAGTAALVERYLRAFGPATEIDVKWWLGSTLGLVRVALADLGAVDVGCGYVLPDDVEPVAPVDPWVALLPPLDPATMGWYERDWYLGPYRAELFDTAGNGGPTAWVDGRIVGGWRQTDSAEVELQLLEDVGAEARAALEAEAARLTEWLAGTRVLMRFPSPLSKT